jgi:hypothetical protein
MPTTETTPEEAKTIAEWMLTEYMKSQRLLQKSAAIQIQAKFGQHHVYRNPNGNPAINEPILEVFKNIRPDDVVWSRGKRLWRPRSVFDPQFGDIGR